MLLLAAIALIVIGPKQLPEVARSIGRFLNELKRVTGDVTKTITDARDFTNDELHKQSMPPSPIPVDSVTGVPPPEGHGPEAGPEANLDKQEPTQSPNKAKNE